MGREEKSLRRQFCLTLISTPDRSTNAQQYCLLIILSYSRESMKIIQWESNKNNLIDRLLSFQTIWTINDVTYGFPSYADDHPIQFQQFLPHFCHTFAGITASSCPPERSASFVSARLRWNSANHYLNQSIALFFRFSCFFPHQETMFKQNKYITFCLCKQKYQTQKYWPIDSPSYFKLASQTTTFPI